MSLLKCTKFLLPVLVLGLLASAPVLAEETHQYEVSASWRTYNVDDLDLDVYTLTGEIYFAPVDAKDKPLAEASFLDRIGSVQLVAARSEYDFDSSYGVDDTTFGINLTYTRPGLPLLFMAGYSYSDFEYDPPYSSWDLSSDTYTVGVGYYFMDTLLASLNYRQIEDNISTDTYNFDITYKYYGVTGKYVHLLSNTTAYNLELGYTYSEYETSSLGDTEDNWSANLAGDYYFTNLLSLGAGVTLHRGGSESSDGEEYLIRSKTFFTHNIGVELEYLWFEANDASVENESAFQVSLIGHF